MKEYKITVNFEDNTIETDLNKLVQNDYNSIKINFEIDKEYDSALFELKYPDDSTYQMMIKDSEVILPKGILYQDGDYEFEISIYTSDSKLTHFRTKVIEVRKELVTDSEDIANDDRYPVLSDLMNENNKLLDKAKETVADIEAFKNEVKNDENLRGPKGNDGYTPVKGTDYWTASDKQEIVTDVLNEVDIPTKTSEITNDSGFITNAVNDLINYYLKSETYSKNEVNTLINNITKVTISIVDTLPTTGESNIIYFVPKTGSANDVYDEYVWISNAWEHIGSTDVDLTGYATENWVNTQIANFLTEAQVKTLITNALTNYALKSEIPTKNSQLQNDSNFITSSDIPEVPTKVSELQNDSGFITSYTETDPTVPSYVKSITEEDITNWNNKGITEITDNIVFLYSLQPGIYIINPPTTAKLYLSQNHYYTTGYSIFMINKEKSYTLLTDYSFYTGTVGSGYTQLELVTPLYGTKDKVATLYSVLAKNNTTSYTPTSDYNPATKKYVDDTIKSKIDATFTLDGTTLNITTTEA